MILTAPDAAAAAARRGPQGHHRWKQRQRHAMQLLRLALPLLLLLLLLSSLPLSRPSAALLVQPHTRPRPRQRQPQRCGWTRTRLAPLPVPETEGTGPRRWTHGWTLDGVWLSTRPISLSPPPLEFPSTLNPPPLCAYRSRGLPAAPGLPPGHRGRRGPAAAHAPPPGLLPARHAHGRPTYVCN